MPQAYPLAVTDIVRETPEAVSVHFSIPENNRLAFAFEAGQYLTVETEINGKKIRRSYSLCCTPHSNTLSVVVKEVPGGLFSRFANRELKVGHVLTVFPPEGRFTLKPSSQPKNYAAFAAGSGITPVFSMLKTALEKESDSRFLLVYGNKTPEKTIFYNALLELKKQYPERLYVEFVFSEAALEGARFGRIDTGLVNFFTKNKYQHLSFNEFYLCGPEMMINTVSETLQSHGISKNNIHYELFTTSEPTETPLETTGDFVTLSIMLDGETTVLKAPKTKVVLDAALDEGLDPPYSCQGGICSTCIGRLTEGKAQMRKNHVLTDAEVAEGLILTCQAQPITPVLHVDYDDV